MPPDLEALWEEHLRAEFDLHDVEATMATMTEDPYVLNLPTLVGGRGKEGVRRFYAEHMIPCLPADTEVVPVSRTVGSDQLIDELVLRFTHDRVIDFMLPGIEATGSRVELPHVVVVNALGDKVHHEHIWWDQASLLVQVGILDADRVPAVGPEAARTLLERTGRGA